MVDAVELSNVVKNSFRRNALRNVLLVDERFPKLHQVGTADFDSPDAEVCQRLYKEFNESGLLCDVENDVEKAKTSVSEHIRKSDLLVLDLHLNKNDPGDTTDATQILQALADSDQFNVVIVYTNEKALNTVAVQLAGSLRGTVQGLDNQKAQDAFDLKLAEVKDSAETIPYDDCIRSYLFPEMRASKDLQKLLGQIARGVERQYRRHTACAIIPPLALKSLTEDYGATPDPNKARTIEAGSLQAKNPWFVCGSLFVVVANKEDSPPENGVLLHILDEALIDWNPGVVRCLLSEIYNCISRTGCPFRSSVGKDVITQVGWLYHALHELAKGDEHVHRVVGQLTSQVIGLLRERVASEASLVEMSTRSLKAIEFKEDPKERIAELQRANGIPDHTSWPFRDVLHALNEFLSSKPFGRQAYVTTGTVLKDESNAEKPDEWWLCVEPQCDTVPEQAGTNRFIRLRMLRLHKRTNLTPLENATRSRFIYVEFAGQRIYLDTRDGTTDTHEVFEVYVARENQISWEGDDPVVRYWRTVATAKPLAIAEGRLIAVSQLRDANASRFLHEAGYHQSRVGVPFVDCSKEDMKALNESKGEKK